MWHTVQCLKRNLRCSVSVHSSKNNRTQDIFKILIVLLSKMVLNFAQSFFFARIKLVRIRWLQNTTRFSFPFSSPPPAFLIPLFSLPVTKRAPFPIWTVWNAGLLLKPQNMSYNRVWKGILIPQYCFFFSRLRFISNFCYLYPRYRFLSQYRILYQDFGKSRFPKRQRGQIPNPVKTFCVFPNPAL